MDIAKILIDTFLTGIYAVFVYFFVVRFVPVHKRMASIGITNKWFVLAFLLFTFGYFKHLSAYFLTVDSNYCKKTEVCKESVMETQPTWIDRIKTNFGFLENIWVENIGEGIVFVLVGMPAFILIPNKPTAAFITGILAHLVAEYTGIHKYFCKNTCNANPLDFLK